MRNRIFELIGNSSLNSTRWQPVSRFIYEITSHDALGSRKQYSKFVNTFNTEMLKEVELTEAQWVKLFELVVKRFYTQM